MENGIVWADIPASDLERAMKFYGSVMQKTFQKAEGMDGIAVEAPPDDPAERNAMMQGTAPVSFDITVGENQVPGTAGCTIYLNGGSDPEGMLQRAVAAGGKLLVPLTDMGEMVGSIGMFLDSEGNRIGVHKPPQM